MQRIRSRLSDDAYLPPGALAVLGALGIGENVEFAHCIDPQPAATHAPGRNRQLAGSRILYSVQQDHIFHGTPSGYRKRVSVAGAGAGALQNVVDSSRIESHQVVKAASVERQFLDLAL